MQELIHRVLQEFWGAWRFRWLAFAITWFIALAGWAVVYYMPNVYEAQAEVYVDTDSILRPLLRGLTVQNNLQNHVRMMRLALLSRPNLQQVANETDLALKADTKEGMNSVIDGLRNRISISTRGGRNLYTIRYKDTHKARAKDVVQTLLNIFMENSLSSNQTANAGARSFLKKQLDAYSQKLNTAEQKLANFKKAHVGEMPSQGQDYFSRLQAAIGKVQSLKIQLQVTQQKRDELERAMKSGSGSVPTGQSGQSAPAAMSPLQAKIQSLQMKLNDMLLQYTNQYPGVIDLKQRIAMLKKQEEQSHGASGANAAANNPKNQSSGQATGAEALALQMNPAYQDTVLSLTQAKANVAALKTELKQQKQEVKSLRSKINIIPEVEAQLKSLTRNYAVMNKRYNSLFNRYEEALLAKNVSNTSDQVQFKVINPPFVHDKPVAPKRGRLITVALVFAFAGGAALAFLLHKTRPVFMNAGQLREVTGVPVIGTIPQVRGMRSPGAVMLSLFGYCGGLFALVLAFVVAIKFDHSGPQALRALLQNWL